VSPKCQVSFCCLWAGVMARAAGSAGSSGSLFPRCSLHLLFPEKGMSFLLHLKSTWLNPFFDWWDPSLGNK